MAAQQGKMDSSAVSKTPKLSKEDTLKHLETVKEVQIK